MIFKYLIILDQSLDNNSTKIQIRGADGHVGQNAQKVVAEKALEVASASVLMI